MRLKKLFSYKFLVLALITTVLSSLGQAAETDQFFAWGKPLADSSEGVDAALNWMIGEALSRTHPNDSCEEVSRAIGHYFKKSNVFHGVHEHWDNERFPIHTLPGSDKHSLAEYDATQIYGVKLKHDRFQGKYIKNFSETLSLSDVRIGLDKVLHFVVVGSYYEAVYRKLRRLVGDTRARHAAIWAGAVSEKSLLGLQGTGVFSYGDLEANWQGFLWYLSLCEGEKPGLTKDVSGKWALREPLALEKFVNPDWDESFNLSTYTKKRFQSVRERLPVHCEYFESAEHAAEVEQYKKRLKPSDSRILLDRWMHEGKLPDPAPQSPEALCAEQTPATPARQ